MSSGTTISMVSGTNGVIDVTKLVGDSECVVDLGGTALTVSAGSKTIISGTSLTSGIAYTRGGYSNPRGGAILATRYSDVEITSATLTNNTADYGGGFYLCGSGVVSGCVITGNSASTAGGGVVHNNASVVYSDCIISGNTTGYTGPDFFVQVGNAVISDCVIGDLTFGRGSATFAGSIFVNKAVNQGYTSSYYGELHIQSGAIIDLTGNINTTPIYPGSGIIIQDNVHILYNHTSTGTTLPTSSVTEISGGTYGGITNYGVLKGPVSIENGGSIVGNGETVIDLSGKNVIVYPSTTAYASGCTFSGGYTGGRGGAFYIPGGHLTLSSCTLTGNTTGTYAVNLSVEESGSAILTNCVIADKHPSYGDIMINTSGKLTISGGSYGLIALSNNGALTLGGNVVVTSVGTFNSGTVAISSGATINLTGNPNPTPITPGGAITFASGGATVLYSSGTVNGSYSIDNLKLPATAKLTNTNVVSLGGNHIEAKAFNSNTVHRISGCTFTGGNGNVNAGRGGVIYLYGANSNTGGKLYMEKTVCSGNTGTVGAVMCVLSGATAFISSSIMSGNTGGLGDIYVGQGGVVIENSIFSACVLANAGGIASSATATLVGSNKIIGALKTRDANNAGNIYISAGAIIDLSGNAIASPIIIPGGGSITISTGGCKVITSAGTTVSIAAGTYKAINKDGTTTT